MKKLFCLLLFVIFVGNASVSMANNETMSLEGDWQFELDPQDKGLEENWHTKSLKKTIYLPGTTDQAGFGEKTA